MQGLPVPAPGVAMAPDLRRTLERELEGLAALAERAGVDADYVRVCGAVASAHAAARQAIRATATASDLSALAAGQRIGRGHIVFADAVLRALLDALGEAAAHGAHGGVLATLRAADQDDPQRLATLAAAAGFGDDARPLQAMAQRLRVPAHALVLVGRLLAAPFFHEARERLVPAGDIDARGQARGAGLCPACGSSPALAVLERDDGRRRLVCSLCGQTWLAPRLLCTSCDTRDSAALATLATKADDPRFIDTCERCRRYLKTVDARRLPETWQLAPRAEEAATLYLDFLAERNGYVRAAF